jgi:uncharacterized membrane protein YoaK (UPF0700 family)
MESKPAVPLKTPAPLFRLLLLLSATTGMLDAASILCLGKVFTANMTGNVVFLAFAAAGAPGFSPLPYLTALGAFVVGATIAGRIWRMPGPHMLRHWLIVAAVIETVLLLLAGIAAIGEQPMEGAFGWRMFAILALTAGAMGFRNAIVRQLKVPDLTTTVLTLTITGLASDSPLAAGSAPNLPARLGAVAMIFGGAAIGALLVLYTGLATTLLVTAGLVLCGTLVFARHPQMAELHR